MKKQLELGKELQNLMNIYMIDKKSWKTKEELERVKDWLNEVFDVYWIKFNTQIKKDLLIEWEIRLLEEMRDCMVEKDYWDRMKNAVKQYVHNVLELI